jgi:hypothetical protein
MKETHDKPAPRPQRPLVPISYQPASPSLLKIKKSAWQRSPPPRHLTDPICPPGLIRSTHARGTCPLISLESSISPRSFSLVSNPIGGGPTSRAPGHAGGGGRVGPELLAVPEEEAGGPELGTLAGETRRLELLAAPAEEAVAAGAASRADGGGRGGPKLLDAPATGSRGGAGVSFFSSFFPDGRPHRLAGRHLSYFPVHGSTRRRRIRSTPTAARHRCRRLTSPTPSSFSSSAGPMTVRRSPTPPA